MDQQIRSKMFCWKARKPSDRTGQPRYVISFCSSCVIHHDSPGYPSCAGRLSYDEYYDNLTKIYFSARWLARAELQKKDIRVLTGGVRIWDSQVKFGQSHLNRDS